MNIIIKDILLIPNLLSVFRLLLSIPLLILFYKWNQPGINTFIILLVLLASFTDILDGFIARKFNQITEIGKIVDPLADKITMGAVLLGMFYNDLLPSYYIILILSRDLLIFIGGVFLTKKIGFVLPSNIVGKLTVLIIGIVILLVLFGFNKNDNPFYILFYFTSIFMIFFSFIVYLIRAIKSLRVN
jgi:CDP-diacylglycerol--glycerol-3-phosphate 3-phosphatidyltransferase